MGSIVSIVFFTPMLKELHQVSTETRLKNPYWEYRVDGYTKPHGGVGEYHYVHTPGSVMIVPRRADGRFVLTRQYRYLNRRVSLEFPGGGLPDGMDARLQALNELHEEAGLTVASVGSSGGEGLIALGVFGPFNGVTDELCNVFFVPDAAPHALPSVPDESEEFEIVALTAAELTAAIRSGELFDGMTLAAWQLYCVYAESQS
jgi:ADP-ribose pyrophosphatase